MKCKYHCCDSLVPFNPRYPNKMFCQPKCKTKYYVDKNRKEHKIKAINYLGGKCKKCGYNRCPIALEFHHLDPSQKIFSISQIPHTRSWARIQEEIDKCELLCSNCHREVEFEKIKTGWEHIINKIQS